MQVYTFLQILYKIPMRNRKIYILYLFCSEFEFAEEFADDQRYHGRHKKTLSN